MIGELLDQLDHITSGGYDVTISRVGPGKDAAWRVEARRPGTVPFVRTGVTFTETVRLLRASMERSGAIVRAAR